jgi:hypothetical protein
VTISLSETRPITSELQHSITPLGRIENENDDEDENDSLRHKRRTQKTHHPEGH